MTDRPEPWVSDDPAQLGFMDEPTAHDGTVSRRVKFKGAHLTDEDVPRLTKQQGRVRAALVMADRPATVDEICETIRMVFNVSDPATSVDRQLRYLRAMGMADNERVGGATWKWYATEQGQETG